jgi:hypothetical protein
MSHAQGAMKINSRRGAERLKVPKGTNNKQGYTDLTILLGNDHTGHSAPRQSIIL